MALNNSITSNSPVRFAKVNDYNALSAEEKNELFSAIIFDVSTHTIYLEDVAYDGGVSLINSSLNQING